jgi:type IV pilus assembly protein PilA
MHAIPRRLRRDDEAEDGFTLPEMTVVMLLIALLISIAIPTFLGAKARAEPRAAQSSLQVAFVDAKTVFADTDSYSHVSPGVLQATEPELSFTLAPSDGPKVVSVSATVDGVVLAAKAANGSCYAIGDGTHGSGTVYNNLGNVSCDANLVVPTPDTLVAPPAPDRALEGGGWARAW